MCPPANVLLQCCYAIDGVTPKDRFDLSCDDGILRLVNFLNELEQCALQTREKFEGIRANLLERSGTEDSRAGLFWTFYSQLSECKLWPYGEGPASMTDKDLGMDAEDSDAGTSV